MRDDGTTTFVRMPDSFGFTQVPNPTVYDGRLPFEALGLLTLLLAKCELAANRGGRWEIRNRHLYAICKERSGWGREKTDKLLATLTRLGYLVSECHRDGGRFAWTRTLYSCPVLNLEYMATAEGAAFRQEVVGRHGAAKVALLEDIATAYGKPVDGGDATIYGSTGYGEPVDITQTLKNTDDHIRAREEATEDAASEETELVAPPLASKPEQTEEVKQTEQTEPAFTAEMAYLVNALVDVTGLRARTARGGWTRAFEESHVPLARELAAAEVTPDQVRAWYGDPAGYWYAGDWRSHDRLGKPVQPRHWQIEETYVRAETWTAAEARPELAQRPRGESEGATQWEQVYNGLRRYGFRKYSQWRDGLDERAQRAVSAIGGSNLAATPERELNPAGYNTARRRFLDLYNGGTLAAAD